MCSVSVEVHIPNKRQDGSFFFFLVSKPLVLKMDLSKYPVFIFQVTHRVQLLKTCSLRVTCLNVQILLLTLTSSVILDKLLNL